MPTLGWTNQTFWLPRLPPLKRSRLGDPTVTPESQQQKTLHRYTASYAFFFSATTDGLTVVTWIPLDLHIIAAALGATTTSRVLPATPSLEKSLAQTGWDIELSSPLPSLAPLTSEPRDQQGEKSNMQ